MVRRQYIHRVAGLRENILYLGTLVEQSLQQAVASLHSQSATEAQWVIERQPQIAAARQRLEERVITHFAAHPPVAHDLHLLAAVVALAAELERIGDYAQSIALRLHNDPQHLATIAWPADIDQMASLVQHMLHLSLEAFLQQDIAQAHSLAQIDEGVDALRDRLQIELLDLAQHDGHHLGAFMGALSVVQILERAANRTVAISERVLQSSHQPAAYAPDHTHADALHSYTVAPGGEHSHEPATP
jgi:phosphate transport system protein